MAEEQIIIEVLVDNAAAEKNIRSQTQAVDGLTQANKELQAQQKNLTKEGKANSAQYTENSIAIAKNKDAINSANASRKDSIKDLKNVNNSLNAQKAALKANKKAIGDVNTATKQGQKEYKKLEKDILNQTKALRKAENAQGTFTRGVGDYGQALSQVNPAMGGAVSGFQAMTKGALAFIATPIGAVIGALGLAIGALTSYFKGSEKGQNDLLKITNTLSAVFEALADVARDVGESIFDAISKPKETVIALGNLIQENITNRFKALGLAGKAIAKIFSGDITEGFKDLGEAVIQGATGVEDIIGKTKALANETVEFFDKTQKKVEENISRATEISKIQIQLAKDERNLLIENAKLDVQIANKRLDAKDEETRTAAERIKLLEEAQVLENKSFDNQIKLAQARLDIQTKQNAQGDSTKEELQEQANLEVELIRLSQSRANAQRKLETEIQTNIKKRDAELAVANNNEIARLNAIAEEKKRIAEEEAELEAERTEQKAADDQKKIEDEKEVGNAKISVAGDVAGAVAGFAEEGTLLAKAAGIAQVGISTAQAIMNVFATVPTPVAPAAAAVVGGLGLAQAAKIAGIFEEGGETFADGGLMKGGMFKGPSHKDGGIKFRVGGKIHEAEGGEAIISKRATAMFKPQLSAMNVAGGGKKFATGGIPLAASSTAGIDSAINAENSISSSIAKQSAPQVAVTDINRTQSNVKVKQVRSRI